MKGVGGFFSALGLVAIILHFFDQTPGALRWIHNWGNGVAWAIMIGLVALGIIILIAAKRKGY